jgi:hypothetical protein
VKSNARSTKVAVSSDGKGLVSQAGAVLLWDDGLEQGQDHGAAQPRTPGPARVTPGYPGMSS